jgi:hypothetical protein
VGAVTPEPCAEPTHLARTMQASLTHVDLLHRPKVGLEHGMQLKDFLKQGHGGEVAIE